MKKLFSLFWLLIFINACIEDEVVHPKLKTLSAEAASLVNIKLSGEIEVWGTSEVIEYGFALSNYTDVGNIIKDSRILVKVGDKPTEEYSADIPINYPNYTNSIYVWAYITNTLGTVYGNRIEVEIPKLSITDFSPTQGKAGDTIAIYGNNFHPSKEQNQVFFDLTPANIVNVYDDQLLVEVPEDVQFNHYNSSGVSIKVKALDQEHTFSTGFLLLPTINYFSPHEGTIGTTLTFFGSNFSDAWYNYDAKVYFSDATNDIQSFNYSDQSISSRVPASITSDHMTISLSINGEIYQFDEGFNIIPQIIDTLEPPEVIAGDHFGVFGKNFIPYPYTNQNEIFINDKKAEIEQQDNDNYLFVKLPDTIAPGDYEVLMKTRFYQVKAPQKLKILPPQINNIEPLKGARGVWVTISGKNFAEYCYVKFGDAPLMEIDNWDNSNILGFEVPPGLSKGEHSITVTSGGTSVIAQQKFLNEGFTVSSISPLEGKTGNLITIEGTGLRYPRVYFNDKIATFISSNYSKIVVSVPNIDQGKVKIAVKVYDETIIYNQDFNILP